MREMSVVTRKAAPAKNAKTVGGGKVKRYIYKSEVDRWGW